MLIGNQALGDVELGSFSIPALNPVATVVVTPTPAEIVLFGNEVLTGGCDKYPRAIQSVVWYKFDNYRPSYETAT